jgi:CHASE2 domain
MEFLLEIDQVGQTCIFKLSGKGSRLSARIPFSTTLPQYYRAWSDAYQSYYTTKAPYQKNRDVDDRGDPNYGSNRGRPGPLESIGAKPIDWEKRLATAENDLIAAFRAWVRSGELFEIRKMLSAAATHGSKPIVLLVQCQDDPTHSTAAINNFFLAKLPWESLGAELSDRVPVHVLRTTSQRPVIKQRKRRSRLRILAIFGDDNGLDFKAERQAIEQKLRPIAYVQFEGDNISPITAQKNLKTFIMQAIEDPQGWDILFFAGHSDDGFGGEVMLAPGYSALINEFEDSLKIARNQGLQFALFNSCRGCAIAESLISYGLSHVVVMRERVSNQVAQVFFQAFADRLANLQDVQTAALGATQALAVKAKEQYQYPSAYLLPSIYAYSEVKPLKPPSFNWRVLLSLLKPTSGEAILLITLVVLSSHTPFQYPLIDKRQAAQGVYRTVTGLFWDKVNEPLTPAPPILVVKLDDNSLQAENASKEPIDRGYIAKLMNKAIALKIPTVGIDYVLKDDMPNQAAVKAAATKGRFIFGASHKWGVANAAAVDPDRRIDGDIDVNTFTKSHPVFLARTIGDPTTIDGKSVKLHSFPYQIFCQLPPQPHRNCELPDRKAYDNPVTAVSRWLGQAWLNPWIDYSIPMSNVYQSISSAKFLEQSKVEQKIVLLVPSEEFDEYMFPTAHQESKSRAHMAGGEIHAYLLYNLLDKGLIMPIPDLWMIGIVGIISKLLIFRLQQLPKERSVSQCGWLVLLVGGPLFAYALSLQTYIGLGIAIPVLFPALTYYLGYVIPYWNQQRKIKRRRNQLLLAKI